MSTFKLPQTAFALALLASAWPMANAARAADLDPGYADVPAPITQQQLTFGSGWYIRGDLGGTRLPEFQVKAPSSTPTPANPTAIPSATAPTLTDSSRFGYVASLGAGYQFTNFIRGDVVVDFHEPIKTSTSFGNGQIFCPTAVSYPNQVTNPTTGVVTYGTAQYASGGCTGNATAGINSYDTLVNAYIDLGNWYRVSPYIGAGVGLSFGHYSSAVSYVQSNGVPYQISYTDPKYNQTFSPNYDRTASGTYYNVAWALMAGFAFDVYDHTKLDIGYRYLNLGTIKDLNKSLTSNEIRAGVRYMIDN